MDLLASKSLLLLLALIGSSVGQSIPIVDAVLGGTVTLKTTVPVPPYNVIIWSFSDGVNKPVTIVTVSGGSEKFSASYQSRASFNRTTGSLTLQPLKTEDSGDYVITVIPTDGETTTDEMKLRVFDPVSDVLITSNLLELIEFNSTVVLNCSAKGSLLRFDWFNGSNQLVLDSPRMTLAKERASSILTMRDVRRTDSAQPIYCEASNSLQRARSAGINLTMFYGPDPVVLLPPTVPQFISSASVFNLSCWAASSPPATFSWSYNQEPIAGVDSVLTLQTVRDKGLGAQLGNYTCTASNAKTLRGAASPVVSFAVIDPLSDARIIGPNSTLVAGTSSANLSCQAAGGVTSREWLKDGKRLAAGARITFSDDMSTVAIRPLQKEDNGEYHCHLKNPVSSTKASYKMVVNFGPEQHQLTGVSKVEENHPVTLTCSATSIPPATFTWKYNGSLTTVTTETYTIQNPQLQNSGVYTCDSFNPVTGKTSTASLTLQVKAEGTLSSGLSDGAIAGIVIAILVAIGAAVALTIYCRQKLPVESPY